MFIAICGTDDVSAMDVYGPFDSFSKALAFLYSEAHDCDLDDDYHAVRPLEAVRHA